MHTNNKVNRRKSKYDIDWDVSNVKIPYLTKEITRQSGIYALYNTETHKFYIGSTVDFIHRRQGHFNALLRDDHSNDYLQKSFNIHGIDKIAMVIIELCEEENLIKREQYYLDLYQTYKREIGYNISEIAGKYVPEGVKYKLFSPEGKLVEGRNLNKFCRENGLSIEAIKHYSCEKKRGRGGLIAGGWRIYNEKLHPNRDLTIEEIEYFKKIDNEKRYGYQRKTYKFLLNGEVVEIENLKEYAKKHNLNKQKLADTYRRNTLPYKGYVSLMNEEIMKRQLSYQGEIVHFLISNDKKLLKISNLRQFCKMNKIDRNCLKRFSKRGDIYKGYFILALNVREAQVDEIQINSMYKDKLNTLFNCN